MFMDLSKIPITDFHATSLNNNGLLEYLWRKFLSVLIRIYRPTSMKFGI